MRAVVRCVVGALLAAALVTGAGPAHAERWSGTDPSGDVRLYDFSRADEDRVTSTAAPKRRRTDLTRYVVRHGMGRIDALVRFREAAATPQLHRRGFGPVLVGMTPHEAIATGWVRRVSNDPCVSYRFRAPWSRSAGVAIGSLDRRPAHVVTISVWRTYRTDRGVGPGSTLAEIRQAYPGRVTRPRADEPGYYWVRVPRGRLWLNFLVPSSRTPRGDARATSMQLSEIRSSGLGGC